MRKTLTLLAVLLAALPSAASAADLYVSPSGGGSSCTLSSPCSLSTANSNAQAGDTVHMRGGTYNTAIAPARSGTSNSNRITYTNHNDERVVFSGMSTPIDLDDDYITVTGSPSQNIIIDQCWNYIKLVGASNNILSYITGSNPLDSGMTSYGSWAAIEFYTGSTRNWMHHCTFSENGWEDYTTASGDLINIGAGSGEVTSHYNLIEDNEFFYGAHAVLTLQSKHNVVRNNYIHNERWGVNDCGKRGMGVKDKAQGPNAFNLIERNRIAYAERDCHDHDLASAIQMSSHDNIVRKNMFYACEGPAVRVTEWENTEFTDDNYFYNNVFFYNGIGGIHTAWQKALYFHIYSPFTTTGQVVKNNIFEDNIGLDFSESSGVSGTVGVSPNIGNYWSGDGDPLFMDADPAKTNDPGNANYPDFRLRSSSPCIDAATHLTLTNSQAQNPSTAMKVDDAHYFFSGDGDPWNIPAYTGITGDYIFVEGWPSPVEIASIDYSSNTLYLASERTWSDNAGVYLAVSPTAGYYGSGPDQGAFEYGSVPDPTETCSELGGYCCVSPQTCPGSSLGSSDCSGTCCSQACTIPQSKSYTALRAPSPPTIDGNPSEFINANPITLTNSRGSSATYRLLWDDSALYISAQAQDDQLNYAVTQRDGTGIWNDDSIELFFDTLHDDGPSLVSDDYKLFVNIGNVQHDSRYDGSGASWDTAFSSVVSLDGAANDGVPDTGYSMEIAIPWSGWGLAIPAPGQSFGFDVNMNDRDDSGTRVWEAWSQASLNVPDGFGDLVFSPEEASYSRSYQTQGSEDTILASPPSGYSYGGLDTFYAGSRGDNDRDRVLIRFPGLISPDRVPQGSSIESATLTLTSTGGQGIVSPIDLKARRVLEPWTEGSGTGVQASPGEVTWDHRAFDTARWSSDSGGDGGPDAGCSSPGSHTAEGEASMTYSANPAEGQASSLDVTAIVQSWADSGEDSNHGFLLIAPGQEGSVKNYVRFASSEFSDPSYRPMLTVELSPRTHRADTSGDGCVDDPELMAFISHFYLDSTSYPMGELMEAVGLWKQGAGC